MSLQFSDEVMAQKFLDLVADVADIKAAVSVADLPEMKRVLEVHDRKIWYAQVFGAPVLAGFHLGIKHFLSRIGL